MTITPLSLLLCSCWCDAVNPGTGAVLYNTVQYLGAFVSSFKAPWPTQIDTESPFNAENNGAYCRCENLAVSGRNGTPLRKLPVFHIENTGNCS